MHYTSGRFVPNNFLQDCENEKQYTINKKIKAHIKSKDTHPLSEKTNEMSKKLQPLLLKQNIQPCKVDLVIDEDQSASMQSIKFQKLDTFVKKEIIERQNSKGEQDEEGRTQDINESVVENEKIDNKQIVQGYFQAKDQKISIEKEQKRIDLELVRKQKKKLFQIEFSSSQSEESETLSVQPQLTLRSQQKQRVFTSSLRTQKQKREEKRKLIFQPNQSDLQSSQSQECQLITPKVEKNEKIKTQKNRFMIDFEDSEDDDDDDESDEDDEDIEQKLIITKTINIKNLIQIDEDYINTTIPENSLMSLIIKRQSKEQQYQIYDNNLLRHILTVRKDGRCLSKIFLKHLGKQESSKEIARVRSNFFGTEFHCYSRKSQNEQKMHLISVKYETNILGLNGPRKMTIYTPSSNFVKTKYENILELYENSSCKEDNGVQKYVNKPPKWNEKINAYVLDFKGRATYSSVKNFILVNSQNEKKQYVLFGKVGKDVFNLDVRHPFTILQAVALGISSFEKKLACE